MLNPIIKFCVNNLARGSHLAMEKLAEDFDVEENNCLRRCTVCERSFYAIVDGKMIKGETVKELLDNIYQYVDDNLSI
ncbi:DUF1450 domain-containing protein [Bacillus kwashiorkori]|uniref:DUF1450 domain-containing protein n=1 Tax=Bacillus kwashiorkori TaxID=1522318 RepID=UPI000781F199|nr:DUF1450 domain-containing protein [Bacillus kwashiorkori]